MSEDLVIEILKPGDGQEAKPGDHVTVHYVGTLTSAVPFPKKG